MPPDLRDPADPLEWLRRARSNLALAESAGSEQGVLFDDLCFEAHQATEKALKAILVAKQVAFPKTHSIAFLLELVRHAAVSVPEAIADSARLTRYAVHARYVGLTEDANEDDYRAAVAIARRVVSWCEEIVRATGR